MRTVDLTATLLLTCLAGEIAAAGPGGGPLSASPSYVVTSITTPALLEGVIRLAGSPPVPSTIDAGAASGSCGGHKPDESLVVGRDGGVANVVVALEGVPAGKPWPDATPVLDQQACVFVPHVLVAPAGGQIQVANSDPVFHNVHAFTWTGRYSPFNLAMPAGAAPALQKLERPGVLSLRCDAGHSWMSGYVYIARTPYHALTTGDGRFRIEGLPPGRHPVTLWHERFGFHRVVADLPPSGTRFLEVEARTGPDRFVLADP